jgi:hypothetical protein
MKITSFAATKLAPNLQKLLTYILDRKRNIKHKLSRSILNRGIDL